MTLKADEVFEFAKEKDFETAFQGIYDGLAKNPKDLQYIEAFAYCYMQMERHAVAFHLLSYLDKLFPNHPLIKNNMAMCASAMASSTGDDSWLDQSEKLLRSIIPVVHKLQNPECVYNNLALCLVNQGDFKGAEVLARKAIELNKEHAESNETLSYALMGQGKWDEGFVRYEGALYGKFRRPKPVNDEPYWKGQTGCKLFVQGEQGIGDEISYASIIPDVAKDNEVTLECDARLEGLFKRSFPNVTVKGTRFKDRNWTADVDFHCLTGSLFPFYRQKPEDFTGKPFLVPDPERVLQWKALLNTLPGRKIGIAWTGGLANTFKGRRSHSLEAFLPILKMKGCTFVALQYTDCREEIEAFEKKHGIKIHYWPRAVAKGVDYDETAALVSCLDSVVTTTTAIVHLCGAIGTECYVAVPKKSRWFYQSDTENHRWYKSVHLFRQDAKWPFERIADRLDTVVADGYSYTDHGKVLDNHGNAIRC